MKRLTQQQREMYRPFKRDFPYCMACGIQNGWRGRFSYPRWLENAHIIGGAGRRADRRGIVRLCKMCHDLSHGERIRHNGELLPRLTLGNILWLKLARDRAHFDPDYLGSLYHYRLPEIAEPDSFFKHEWETNRKDTLWEPQRK
jgi:hypothetical protein